MRMEKSKANTESVAAAETETEEAEQRSPFRSDILLGQVALITGGGSGIGFEIAKQLGVHGASVVLLGRRLWVLQRAAESLRHQSHNIQVETIQGEVRSLLDAEKAVEFTLSKFGRLDILVNSAAGNFLAPAETLTPKGFKTVLEIDTVGTFNMCHASFPALRKDKECGKKGGVIINISATLHYGASWYQSHASAAKAAIDSLTRSLCLEWGPEYGIRVNGIAPGPVGNTAGASKLSISANAESAEDRFRSMIPVGRLGSTWDIAMAAVFLVSNAASWVSGETFVVDGGNWLYKAPMIPREQVLAASRAVEPMSRKVGIPENTPRSKL